MKPQEISKEVERIQGILGDDYEVKSLNGLVVVDKKHKLVKYLGWDYGKIPCEIQFHFIFDQSIFRSIKFQELGLPIEDCIKKYLTQ